MIRKFLINFLILFISIAFTLIVLETAFRLYIRSNPVGWKFTLYDAELGACPGLEITNDPWIWLDDADFDTLKNDHVMIMDQRVPFRKGKGKTRIVSIGDSGTQGAGVSFEETYPLVFQKLLREKGDENVEVINAGMNGTTTIAQYSLLEKKLLKLKPDIVTVGLFMENDINLNLSPQNFVGPNSGLIWSFIYKATRTSVLAQFLYTEVMLFNSMFHLFNFPVSYNNRFPFRAPEKLEDFRGLNPLHYFEGEYLGYLREEVPLMEEAYSLLENILAEMKQMGMKHGFQLAVVLIPAPSTVARKIANYTYPELEQHLREKNVVVEELDFEKPTRRVLAICQKLNLVCIDPTEEVRKVKKPYITNDEHLNGAGYLVVAQKMTECFDIAQHRFASQCK